LQKDNVKEVAETRAVGVKLEHITRTRDAIMEKLERLLTHWMNGHNQHYINLSLLVIHEKVLSLLMDLKKMAVEEGAASMKHHEYRQSRPVGVIQESCKFA
jgi:hypothetical protein